MLVSVAVLQAVPVRYGRPAGVPVLCSAALLRNGLAGAAGRTILVFFFSSCTTALLTLQDATSSFDTLRALSRMTSCGMNVIMVIHQPRYTLYELFDSLLLLGVGGVTVYNGPPLLTERWFSNHGFNMPSYDNMADFNLDVISGKVIVPLILPSMPCPSKRQHNACTCVCAV